MKHGWIIESKIDKGFYVENEEICSDDISDAKIFRTRKEAREEKYYREVVRKVSIEINIIPGR